MSVPDVVEGSGWVVMRLSWTGGWWFPLEFTFRRTRREAIKAAEAVWPAGSGDYCRRRRRGEVKVVRCHLVPEDPR